MRFFNLGSLNLDYVYNVDHIVKPGETLSSDAMREKLPHTKVLFTLGADGSIGYFLFGYCSGMPVREAMKPATDASSISIGCKDAAKSIPWYEEIKTLHLAQDKV